jgi:hypothetical protein
LQTHFYHFSSPAANPDRSGGLSAAPASAARPAGAGGFQQELESRLSAPAGYAPLSDNSPLLALARGGSQAPLFSTREPAPRWGGLPQPFTLPGQEEQARPLGEALSSYGGPRFASAVTTGQPQWVGGSVHQFHFPHLVEKDGKHYAYFIDHSGGRENEIGLAVSEDGVNFEYQGKVLGRGEDYDALQASFPGVAHDSESGQWAMLYEAKSATGDVNSVCLATSSDGLEWTKHGPVISPGDAGEMSAVDVGTPTLFKEDGVWHVYFHGLADDGRVRIGYASGQELTDLTVRRGPALDTDAEGLESGTVGARSNLVKMGGYYYMAYEACTALTDFSQSQWGINLARAASPDGPWEKMDGPLAAKAEPGFGADGPELALMDDKLYLYYRYGDNQTARMELSGLPGQQRAAMAGAPPGGSA